MFKLKIIITLIITLAFVVLKPNYLAAADDLNTLRQQSIKKSSELQANQKLAQEKAKEAAARRNEVDRLQALIEDTQASIDITANNINLAQLEIEDLTNQIEEKEKELALQKKNLFETIKVVYESGDQSTLEVVLGSDSITDVIDRAEYLQSVQVQIETTMNNITRIKADLENNRQEQEKKKQDLKNLKSQQVAQQRGLEGQKKEKDDLLSKAVSAQTAYESKVQEAKTALAALNAKIAELQGGKGRINGGPVKQGDIIGYEGNTGFSTGPHLHFTVYNNGSAQNPRDYLGKQMIWPIDNFRITQEYGPAQWNSPWYSFHNGMDFASNDGYGAPIRAAANGTIIWHAWNGGYGNCVIIDHGNGLWTLYGHMID